MSGSLRRMLPNVRFMELNYEMHQDVCSLESFSATSIIQDLILLTSYLCSTLLEQKSCSKQFATCETSISAASSVESLSCNTTKCGSSSSSSSNNNRGQSITATLIALAPFWAIASLVSQFGCGDDISSNYELKSALTSLLRSPLAFNSCMAMSEDCLQRLAQSEHNYLSSVASFTLSPHHYLHHQLHILQQEHQDSLLMRLTTRLRKSLRSHLAHPLLFCIVLAVSLRNDLSAKARAAFVAGNSGDKFQVFQRIFSQSDENSLNIAELVVTMAPKLVLQSDITNQQSTPLIYLSAHRAVFSVSSLPEETEKFLSTESLVLGLVQILTDYVPSALTLSDTKGMYPLHFAARRGYSSVMLFLASRFGSFSLSLLDNSGKYPLHHALLSHHIHDEDTIVHLASLCPQLLNGENSSALYDTPPAANSGSRESLAFKPLHYARKISVSLQDRLNLCLSRWRERQQELSYPVRAVSTALSTPLEATVPSDAGSLSHTAGEDSSLEEGDSPIVPEDFDSSSAAALAATSSLYFFAQSLLMMQHDSSSQIKGTTTASDNSFKKNSKRKLKRSAADLGEEPSSFSGNKYKRQKCNRLQSKPMSEAVLGNSDDLTSGDSSVASVEVLSL